MKDKLIQLPNGLKVAMSVPVFKAYTKSEYGGGGCLCATEACHGLMYYALTARNTWEECCAPGAVVWESEDEPNWRQQIESISTMYDCEVDDLIKHWDCVDGTFLILGLPLLPKNDKYRHTHAPLIINTKIN